MAATATLGHTLAALRWSNNTEAQRFSNAVPQELLHIRKAILQTEFDSLHVQYVTCKTHYRRWQLSGWRIVLGGYCPDTSFKIRWAKKAPLSAQQILIAHGVLTWKQLNEFDCYLFIVTVRHQVGPWAKICFPIFWATSLSWSSAGGRQNGLFPPLEIGIKNHKFQENQKSAA